MVTAQITNPAGVWGAPATADGQAGEIQSWVASTAITKGQIVALSTTAGQIVPALTNANTQTILGVAAESASAGNPCLVVQGGVAWGVLKSTAAADNIAQFDRITVSVTTTAAASKLASTTAVTQIKDIGALVGVALQAATTGATTVDMWIIRW